MRSVRASVGRVLRATRILVSDERVPRWLRWLGGLALLPIPGPFDEAVLLLIAPVLFTVYRTPTREAWREAATGEPRG